MSAECFAKYACDTCRTRKISCSRELPECSRCKAQETACSYSRTGVIRRHRKRKATSISPRYNAVSPDATPENTGKRQRLSSPDIHASITDRLRGLIGRDHRSLRELATLMEEYHTAWQGSSTFDQLAKGAQSEYFDFEEDQTRKWMNAMMAALHREQSLYDSAPSQVVEHLVASRPLEVEDRAWLVIFYSIALSVETTTSTMGDETIAKLSSNLWSAFNDVRFLLESSILNIQALITMAHYAERFMTPSICWSLISKACTMLLALGVGARSHMDSLFRQRLERLFWRLKSMDQALALILSRVPIFQRELTMAVPLPELNQLLPSTTPHVTNDRTSVLFDAHHMHQMNLLSRIMTDVWSCLPGQEETRNANKVLKDLESWYSQATKILEASAVAEMPLLSGRERASVDLRLKTLPFHYYYLEVMLTIMSKELRSESIYPAQRLLGILPCLGELVTNAGQTNTPLLWQWLHYPMIAFGTLWGQLVSKGRIKTDQSEKSLKMLEHVPAFIAIFRSRNPLAMRLVSITEKIIHHVRSIYYSIPSHGTSEARNSARNLHISEPSNEATFDERMDDDLIESACSNDAFDMPTTATDATFDTSLDAMFTLPDDFFFDPTFDWSA